MIAGPWPTNSDRILDLLTRDGGIIFHEFVWRTFQKDPPGSLRIFGFAA